jgi:nucleotide-binding universal stress UspA family protein
MFKHILVPTDLGERSLKALQIAVKMARQDLSMVTLLHVIEVIEDTEHEEFEEFYKKLARRADKKMEKMINQCKPEDFSVEKQIIYGRRVKDILKFAEDREIDLIVLSSHKIDIDNAVQGWGTISYKVGILSHCPVMLVK